MPTTQPLIELRHITKTYHSGGQLEQAVLKGIDITIYPHEQVAIMGSSGAGKTTLMNIIALLDAPTTGEYFLNGSNVATLTSDERASVRNLQIGFVFQLYFLLPHLTIAQNVGLPLYYRKTSPEETRTRALEVIEKVGLTKFADYKPSQLSGGMQQRAAIARALIGHPTFIIADEPTGALDSKTGAIIMDLFKELNQTEKVTIVIVTHDPDIAALCQRTLHIHDGKMVD